ncbi:GrpB family protein [Cohnella boryungensis]|uniref:GrpB family protein n=1 Tax=Cohnella boryungensis TaxID=768479 RepID=A0ABV8SH02_9BACL
MELDEEIIISEYDPEWPLWYIDEACSLHYIFGPEVHIEHFGSTSIPGLAAKPIVDILVGITNFPNVAASQLQELKRLGYERPGSASTPGRLYFRKRGARSFNLAVTQFRSDLWNDNLIIRDYLRQNPNEARHYAEHKMDAYKKGFRTLLAYSDQKSDFIMDLLSRAKKEMK